MPDHDRREFVRGPSASKASRSQKCQHGHPDTLSDPCEICQPVRAADAHRRAAMCREALKASQATNPEEAA